MNLISTSERWIFSRAPLVSHERPGRGCSDLQGYISTVWVSISIIMPWSFCVAMEPSVSLLVFSDSQYSFGYSGFVNTKVLQPMLPTEVHQERRPCPTSDVPNLPACANLAN